MLNIRGILVRALALAGCAAALGACGQKGPLFLPTEPAAAQRATLPQTLRPGTTTPSAPSAPAAPASSPAP